MIKETNLSEEQDMPRGRKKQETLTLEEQLQNLENQIAEADMNLKSLKAKKKEHKCSLFFRNDFIRDNKANNILSLTNFFVNF